MTNSNVSDSQLQQAYQKAFKAYIGRNNVTGLDIGYKYVGGQRTDDIVVRIHVREKIPETALEAAQVFPRDIDGIPVDIIQAVYESADESAVVTRETLFQRQRRQSVIQPGLSISHPNVSAGTFGTVVYDNLTGRPCMLSNWHVIVGSNNASPGDDIIQPGFADGGRLPQDRVGQLERSILNAEGDAAIAVIDLTSGRSLDLTQYETGVTVQSARMAKIGDILGKSGRTTGVTQGRVDGFGAYTIPYSVGARTIQGFKIVPVIDGNPNNDEISSGGDSGSIWYDSDTHEGIGLHFAGETSPNPRQEHAISCHLPIVLDALNISLMPIAKQGVPLLSAEAVVGSLQEVIDNNLFIPYGDIETSPLAANARLCEEIQRILAENNFYRYRIDSIYGRRTRQALRDFKAAHSVGGGDILGPTTADILLRLPIGTGGGRCPFAVWTPITGSSGSYLGGPFKIVHHTTEGSTAAGAMSAYRSNRSDPHFTVDANTIYQHISTDKAARSLRNSSGGVQTNRDSAIQIEVVAFAGRSKDRRTLENVARLCRWIERTYDIPQVWPNGFPEPAINGENPASHGVPHNRNARTWDTEGGHYGHSHVPENTHWDPAYTPSELEIVMGGVLRTLETAEAFEAELLRVPEIEVEIDNLKLITYPVTVNLDANGQGDVVLDVAWERVTAVIPQAVKNARGVWESCTVALTEQEGQTLLVATNGHPETKVTILVKVLDSQLLSPEAKSLGCPLGDHETTLEIKTVDNETPIELEEVECEAPPIIEEVTLPEAVPFPAVNVQLPERGTGFYSYSRYRHKQFGLAETIRAIETICHDWFLNHRTGPLIGIGNISVRGGGPVPPHSSHQRGVDVDIRPLRSDGARVSVRYQDAAYSRSRTQELVNTIRANSILSIDIILFNDPDVVGVQPWPGHDDHLHVRFRV